MELNIDSNIQKLSQSVKDKLSQIEQAILKEQSETTEIEKDITELNKKKDHYLKLNLQVKKKLAKEKEETKTLCQKKKLIQYELKSKEQQLNIIIDDATKSQTMLKNQVSLLNQLQDQLNEIESTQKEKVDLSLSTDEAIIQELTNQFEKKEEELQKLRQTVIQLKKREKERIDLVAAQKDSLLKFSQNKL